MTEPNTPTQPVEPHSPILGSVARLAVPLTFYVALIIFFQGHNKPGGGFIAGVLAVAASGISLLAFGVHRPFRFAWWIVPVLGVAIYPISGYCAVAITLVVGTLMYFSIGGRTVANYPWWRMACVGLLISITTGIVPMFGGYAFMDHAVWHTHLPVLGDDHLPTATFFDLGVFLIVMGTLTGIFVELGQEGE